MSKITAIAVVLILCLACARQVYFLPDFEEVHATPYGAFIRLKTVQGMIVTGELLALEEASLIIGSTDLHTVRTIDTLQVTDHYIQFAKNRRFGYPVLIAVTHGLWMVFTVPVNAVLTQITNAQERKELRFHDRRFNDLKSYARYPQGIPEGFDRNNYVTPPRKDPMDE